MIIAAGSADVGSGRVDDDEPDVGVLLQFAFQMLVVGEAERPHLAFRSLDALDVLDASQVGVSSVQSWDDGISQVVLTGDKQHVAGGGGL